MKKTIQYAKVLLYSLGLQADEQELKRAYWRHAKYGPVDGFLIVNVLQTNGIAKPISSP